MSLPFPRNERFVGRKDQLQTLEKSLILPKIHRRLSIYGLGGRGKSALALEFAYCALAKQMKVFWVPAISRDSFELAYRDIGIYLRIPGITDDNADVRKLVNEELSSGRIGAWLLIIDNVDDPEVLPDILHGNSVSSRLGDSLPHSNAGAILFTTRSRKVAAQLTPSDTLELNDMSEAESKDLLKRRITKQELCQDDMANNKLLQMLTYLPLAIVQAAAFMNSNNVDVSTYIEIFEDPESRDELFSELFEDPTRYPEMDSTIARTWYISFDHLRKQDQLAAEYLSFMACIDRIKIPQSLLPPGEKKLRKIKAIGSLTGYAFITELQQTSHDQRGERFFDMHRLVHMASIFWLEGKGQRANWASSAATRLEELVPYGDHDGKRVWINYLSHAIYVAGLIDIVDNTTRGSLLERVGCCQIILGQYATAETSYKQSSTLKESIFGPEHPDTLKSMNNLALVLLHQGKHEEAEPINKQTLARLEEVLGPDDSVTLTSKANLAEVLGHLGKNEEAELLIRQTLAQQEKTLGLNHAATLASKNNLAARLQHRGKYDESESLLRSILIQQEEILGPTHPNTMSTRSNLAGALQYQGKFVDAEVMIRSVLAQQEEVLGPTHPNTISSRNKLAGALQCLSRYEEAEHILRPLLIQQEEVLGPNHPEVLWNTNSLAHILGLQGKFLEAETMNKKALALQKQTLGPSHPETAQSMMTLTFILESQYKDLEAISLRGQTLALRKEILGPEHPDTLMTMYCLGRLLTRQRNYSEARALLEKAQGACVENFGEDHPSTRLCRQYYSEMIAAQEQDGLAASSILKRDSLLSAQTGIKSKFSRGLAKIGIRRSRSPLA